MMKILITGFAPFGGQSINPAYEAVKALPDTIGKARIIKAEIPVVFRRDMEVLKALIDQHQPDAVICVGQAGGRSKISFERVAINVMDCAAPDNAGFQPKDEPVISGGPAAYFSTLPIRAMEDRVRAAQIPCEISNSAGTYVCNDIMYRLLASTDKPAGFIHVPYLPQQVEGLPKETPSMPLETIAKALEEAVLAMAE